MRWLIAPGAALALALAACGGTHTVKVEPVEIKPIHMTVDVNVKVDRELDKFFDFEEEGPANAPKKPEEPTPEEPAPPADQEDPS